MKWFSQKCLVSQMTLLQTFSGKLSTIAEHSEGNIFLQVCVCWSQKVSTAGLQRWKKRSVSQNITRVWGKNVSKKTTRSIGGMNFSWNKKNYHKVMQYITFNGLQIASQIHFLGFLGNTKMPNCIVFFLQYHSPWR